MDWDNDGRKDLLTGESYGYVRIYLNTNTDADPQFSGFVYLQKGGSNYDAGTRSVPYVVDWNNDGKKDVICGETYGRVQLLINTGTDANPVFDSAVYIQDGAGILDMGEESGPIAADWNRDGKKDLIIGDDYGKIYYYENKGSDQSPIFNGYTLMAAGGVTLDVKDDSRPCVTDWDNDGVLDLLVGDDGYGTSINAGVWYYHALGPLSLSENRIHEGTGGVIDLDLNAGPTNGGRDYIVLGSTSGTAPGIPLPGGKAVLPVNWDFFTNAVIAWMNTPVFQNFMGTLDGSGEAKAVFDTLGPIPGTAGINLSFAYALNKPWDYASNGANIEIVP